MPEKLHTKPPAVRHSAVMLLLAILSGAADAQGPAFDCHGVEPGSIEQLICTDTELAALDRKLAAVYQTATEVTEVNSRQLKATQRGWLKGRDECWKDADATRCIAHNYRQRIAELQATFELVPSLGPVNFTCDNAEASTVAAVFFETDPGTMLASRGSDTVLLFVQPSGSGAKYQGQNVTFWEHHGEARINWGHEAEAMRCIKSE